jgi:predicted transcriptional regulator
MNELKEVRLSLNLSQVEAAKLLHISRRTYQTYEALKDTSSDKYQYYLFKLKEESVIDENHGILTFDFIKKKVTEVLSKYDVNFCYLSVPMRKRKQKRKAM